MEERRSNGFRVKPSFGQVLGYIQEGEPLTLDLPNRKASIYTSSHWYLDDYPNAPEPLSDAPLPHTTLNPAAAFETADEGYDGVPFPRPPREFTRPSFLPDSDMDPGQALRNDGLNPPRPHAARPHEGERHSGRGGDRGGRRGGRGGRGEERVGEPDDAGPSRRWRLAGPHAEDPEAAAGTGPPTGRGASTANHREAHGSGAPCWRGRGSGRRRWSARRRRTSRASLPSSWRRRKHRRGGGGRRGSGRTAEGGGMLAALGEGALAAAGTVGAATGGLAVAGAGAALVGTAWAIEGGLNAASHLMNWGAATGGGTDSDASRPSRATDVQTLNSMQESGAVDHFQVQEMRRQQRPEVFRIDTSEEEPQAQPRQQIRARPIRRQGRQQPTPFGINQVPIPVSSDSDRISRQSRSDRGPLGTQGSARPFAQPSFDALRQASEPEAA